MAAIARSPSDGGLVLDRHQATLCCGRIHLREYTIRAQIMTGKAADHPSLLPARFAALSRRFRGAFAALSRQFRSFFSSFFSFFFSFFFFFLFWAISLLDFLFSLWAGPRWGRRVVECGARKREGERGKYSEGHARTHGESSAGCGIVVPFTLSRLLLSSEDLGSGPVSVRFRSGFGPVSVRFRSGIGPRWFGRRDDVS
jgi:hypothetical protein